MKSKFIIGIILLFSLSLKVWCLSLASKQKYPYGLLTDDYGILTENDLAIYTLNSNSEPFSDKQNSGAYNYWQCFPRDHVSISFEDMGYSSENIGWKDTLAEMKITVWIKPGVFHEYEMRRTWAVTDSLKDFTHWHHLMKGEKYVCLAGHFVSREHHIEKGVKTEVYGWIFDKIKTKKGCASYFEGDCGYKKLSNLEPIK